MKLKLIPIFLIVLILLFPAAFAEVSVDILDKEVYNLGDKFRPAVTIKESEDTSGFLKMILNCADNQIEYFTVQQIVEANSRTQVPIPDLILEGSMMGSCTVMARYVTGSMALISEAESGTFEVDNGYSIEMETSFAVQPGEKVLLQGAVRNANGDLVLNGDVNLLVGDQTLVEPIIQGAFEHELLIDGSRKAGPMAVVIKIEDKYGNYADALVKGTIIGIPTRVENRIEKDPLLPIDALNVKVILYDHTDAAIEDAVMIVDLLDVNGDLLVEKDVPSLSSFVVPLDHTFEPGTYEVISIFENLQERLSFTVEEYSKISMSLDGTIITIMNEGNVKYKGETIISLSSDEKSYEVDETLKLDPGESTEIDISKEVRSGVYDITLPEGTSENPFIGSVVVEDKRNFLKKSGDGLGSITGAVASGTTYVANNPMAAVVVLALIILGTIFYYTKDVFTRKLKHEKPGSTDNIFKDFNYDDENRKL